MVSIGRPLMISYLTSIVSNFVSLTVFEMFNAEVHDLDLRRFKAMRVILMTLN